MQDNLKFTEKQIQKNRIDAKAARRQAELERNKSTQFNTPEQQADRNYHYEQARQFDIKADQLQTEADALEPKKVEIEARINELKAERETINRETLDRTIEIDKELARIQ